MRDTLQLYKSDPCKPRAAQFAATVDAHHPYIPAIRRALADPKQTRLSALIRTILGSVMTKLRLPKDPKTGKQKARKLNSWSRYCRVACDTTYWPQPYKNKESVPACWSRCSAVHPYQT